MKSSVIFCLYFVIAVVLGETTEFVAPLTSQYQLYAEQDTQRHFGDIIVGMQEASGFASMASSKMQANIHKYQQAQTAYPSYLEVELKLNGQEAQVLEKRSTLGKITALKYFYLQLMTTQSDVQMAYYANKALVAAFPQIAMLKMYKNYLSIFAVSSALQLHDSFTQEAYLEDFNQNFGSTARKSAQVAEAVSEVNLYNNWQQLVTMRLFLMYMSFYDNSMSMAYTNTNTTSSFLETESQSQPTQQAPGQQNALYMQYMYMVYFSSMLKYYCLFVEMSIPQYGSMMAYTKLSGLTMLTDDVVENDEAGRSTIARANYLDDVVVPSAITQWSNIVLMRYYIEFYVFMLEMYLPTLAAQRMYLRADSAVLNQNLLQTDEPKIQQN